MSDDASTPETNDTAAPGSQFVDISDYSYEGYAALSDELAQDAADAELMDAINEGSTQEALALMEEDPELGARTIFVAPEEDNDGGQLHLGQIGDREISIDAPEGGVLDKITDAWRTTVAVQEGVERANEYREQAGLEALDEVDAELAAMSVADGQSQTPGSFADVHYDDISTVYMSPHSGSLEVGAHELSHAATNAAFNGDPEAGGVSSFQNEAIAQTTAQLASSRYLPAEDVAGMARHNAMSRAPYTLHDLVHMGDVDAQLKLAHQMETNPEKVLREAGGTITGQEKWVRENLVMTGDQATMLSDYDHMTMASAFVEETLSGDPLGVPAFTRDGIVVLLNAERELIAEQGMDNNLTKQMDEVRDKSPEAFKQAEEYAEKNYGEKPVVRQTPRMGM